ncbi:hypothetical protein TCON_1281 [Astathelohania contejeani]|uniref:Uncharacterized protein n=1 Tax=Astathelohania contejeani TaxID=164912 RepID=A0ABQ7HZ86_9MICR|nr:hypothetical protein TCON_1281 [Thelohania contejeani]
MEDEIKKFQEIMIKTLPFFMADPPIEELPLCIKSEQPTNASFEYILDILQSYESKEENDDLLGLINQFYQIKNKEFVLFSDNIYEENKLIINKIEDCINKNNMMEKEQINEIKHNLIDNTKTEKEYIENKIMEIKENTPESDLIDISNRLAYISNISLEVYEYCLENMKQRQRIIFYTHVFLSKPSFVFTYQNISFILDSLNNELINYNTRNNNHSLSDNIFLIKCLNSLKDILSHESNNISLLARATTLLLTLLGSETGVDRMAKVAGLETFLVMDKFEIFKDILLEFTKIDVFNISGMPFNCYVIFRFIDKIFNKEKISDKIFTAFARYMDLLMYPFMQDDSLGSFDLQSLIIFIDYMVKNSKTHKVSQYISLFFFYKFIDNPNSNPKYHIIFKSLFENTEIECKELSINKMIKIRFLNSKNMEGDASMPFKTIRKIIYLYLITLLRQKTQSKFKILKTLSYAKPELALLKENEVIGIVKILTNILDEDLCYSGKELILEIIHKLKYKKYYNILINMARKFKPIAIKQTPLQQSVFKKIIPFIYDTRKMDEIIILYFRLLKNGVDMDLNEIINNSSEEYKEKLIDRFSYLFYLQEDYSIAQHISVPMEFISGLENENKRCSKLLKYYSLYHPEDFIDQDIWGYLLEADSKSIETSKNVEYYNDLISIAINLNNSISLESDIITNLINFAHRWIFYQPYLKKCAKLLKSLTGETYFNKYKTIYIKNEGKSKYIMCIMAILGDIRPYLNIENNDPVFDQAIIYYLYENPEYFLVYEKQLKYIIRSSNLNLLIEILKLIKKYINISHTPESEFIFTFISSEQSIILNLITHDEGVISQLAFEMAYEALLMGAIIPQIGIVPLITFLAKNCVLENRFCALVRLYYPIIINSITSILRSSSIYQNSTKELLNGIICLLIKDRNRFLTKIINSLRYETGLVFTYFTLQNIFKMELTKNEQLYIFKEIENLINELTVGTMNVRYQLIILFRDLLTLKMNRKYKPSLMEFKVEFEDDLYKKDINENRIMEIYSFIK